MLLFRSEEEAAAWCRARGRPVGALVGVGAARELARRWYGDRLDPGWRARTAAESQAILDEVGLTGPAWRLG